MSDTKASIVHTQPHTFWRRAFKSLSLSISVRFYSQLTHTVPLICRQTRQRSERQKQVLTPRTRIPPYRVHTRLVLLSVCSALLLFAQSSLAKTEMGGARDG